MVDGEPAGIRWSNWVGQPGSEWEDNPSVDSDSIPAKRNAVDLQASTLGLLIGLSSTGSETTIPTARVLGDITSLQLGPYGAHQLHLKSLLMHVDIIYTYIYI